MAHEHHFIKLKHFVFFISFTLIFISCTKVPLTNRKQMNLLPEKELMAMSLTQYNDFLNEHPPASPNDQSSILVKQTGRKIALAVTDYMTRNKMGDRVKGYKWEFNLVNSNEVNAWCMPGGKVVVYSGLLPVTKDEAGLAFVMGHEIAHAIARHGNERMSQMLLAQTGSIALDIALMEQPAQTKALYMTAFGIGAQVGVLLPYSRLHESEADKLGMIFMAIAGYDPTQAPVVWERMVNHNKGPKPPELLSTHPGDQRRINDLKKFIPEARKFYSPGKS